MSSDRDQATFSRRQYLQLGLGAALGGIANFPIKALGNEYENSNTPKRVAAVVTIYGHNSHADVILTKILEGWKHDGGPGPSLKLASIYIDQPEGSEFGLKLLEKHGIPHFSSIEKALTLGGSSVPIDGVLIIGEHGNYPVNKLGQQLYPRKRFFQEVANTFQKYDRVVPVFNDKHLSSVWDDAKWIYDRAVELKIPLMAGSSLPVSYRSHPFDLPIGSEIEAAVGIGYSGLDIYGFHALECYQALVERRNKVELGVKSVQCLEGNAVWQAVENGWVAPDVMDVVYSVIPKSRKNIREDDGALLFHFEYEDGFHGAQFMLPSAMLSGVGVKRKGQKPEATGFEERPEPRYPHFAYLLKGIEAMIQMGKPPYPVERTLLTGGILDRALKSKFENGRKLETPELAITYTPVDYPYAPHPKLE